MIQGERYAKAILAAERHDERGRAFTDFAAWSAKVGRHEVLDALDCWARAEDAAEEKRLEGLQQRAGQDSEHFATET